MDNSYHYCIIINNDYDNEIQQECTPNMNTFKVGDMIKCRSEKAVISKIAPSWRRATVQEVYDHLKKR